MTAKAAREKLHSIVDLADDTKIFELLALFEEGKEKNDYVYTDEVLHMLEERSEQYLSGKSKIYSVEESLEMIRQHRKNHGKTI